MVNPAYVGIDFGTSNSSVAWFNPKTRMPEIILNAEGRDKTPSLVYYGEGEVLVGEAAAYLLADMRWFEGGADPAEAQWIIRSVKRRLVNPPVIALGGGRQVRPVEVAAKILEKLRHDAQQGHFHAPVERAVVTYPAEFDGLQQGLIREAARLAGFQQVVLLKEPEAAALAFLGMGQNLGDAVLVYDLGGGTFDLSVLVRDGQGRFEFPLPSEGDPRLGGDDFDQALYRHCADWAMRESGLDPALDDAGGVNLRLLEECRKCKEYLSTGRATAVSTLLRGQPFRREIARETFEDLIRDTVERTLRRTGQMVERAARQGCTIDTVVLIGGSTRIPLIRRRLSETLPIAPLAFDKADLAVALGAALHAHELWRPVSVPDPPAPPPPEPRPAVPDATRRFCTRCGAGNFRHSKFCQKCGGRLLQAARHCPGCQAELPVETRFCTRCGTSLDPQPSQS